MELLEHIRGTFEEKVGRPYRLRRAQKDFTNARYSCSDAEAGFGDLVKEFPEAATWQDLNGHSILHWAASSGQADFCAKLLDLGAAINAANVQGTTPLHYAAQVASAPDRTAALKLLLSRGADIEARDNEGQTPLMFAVERNKPWNVKELALAGADPDAPRNDGLTPRSDAARMPTTELSDAIGEGLFERKRRAEEAARKAEEARRDAAVTEAVQALQDGLSQGVRTMAPLKLKR